MEINREVWLKFNGLNSHFTTNSVFLFTGSRRLLHIEKLRIFGPSCKIVKENRSTNRNLKSSKLTSHCPLLPAPRKSLLLSLLSSHEGNIAKDSDKDILVTIWRKLVYGWYSKNKLKKVPCRNLRMEISFEFLQRPNVKTFVGDHILIKGWPS